jgi:hypothetical protein
MDAAKGLLSVAKSKLQDAYQQHVQPLTLPPPIQHRRSGHGQPAQTPQAGTIQPLDVRVARFRHELLSEHIDIAALKRLAFHGIPDKDGLRAITWKVRAPGAAAGIHVLEAMPVYYEGGSSNRLQTTIPAMTLEEMVEQLLITARTLAHHTTLSHAACMHARTHACKKARLAP